MKNYKSLYDLNEEQLDCLKQNYLTERGDVDWYSLSNAREIVTFEPLEEAYGGMQFCDDDFSI